MESAVYAGIGAGVRDIDRDEHVDGVAKALAGDALAPLGHQFEIGVGGRRDEGHEVVDVQT